MTHQPDAASDPPLVTAAEVRQALRALGLPGRAICVHASLRSFGWVQGGARTLIATILAEGCTLMVPAFAWSYFGVPQPPHVCVQRNGVNPIYAEFLFAHREVFTPDCDIIDRYDMGVLPAAVLATPGRARGDHPLCSMAALGPNAQTLIAGQTWHDVYAPFRALAAQDGAVVLMGVGLPRMTLLHYAEQQAGRVLFLRWANAPSGDVVGVEVGGCSEGFERLAPVLASVEQRCTVGSSLWRVFPARAALTYAVAAIREHPRITHCLSPDCARCDDAMAGGRILETGL